MHSMRHWRRPPCQKSAHTIIPTSYILYDEYPLDLKKWKGRCQVIWADPTLRISYSSPTSLLPRFSQYVPCPCPSKSYCPMFFVLQVLSELKETPNQQCHLIYSILWSHPEEKLLVKKGDEKYRANLCKSVHFVRLWGLSLRRREDILP